MTPDLTTDELLTPTRAVRKRLGLSRPVPRALLEECIEIALQAASASNTQSWHFFLVDDPAAREEIARWYRKSYDDHTQMPAAAYGVGDPRGRATGSGALVIPAPARQPPRGPALLLPCVEGRLDSGAPLVAQASVWGPILPTIWSFMLAARARRLGTVWTTLHLTYADEIGAVLGIPDSATQAGLVPVAYHTGTTFKPASRLRAGQVVHWNGW